MPENSRGQCLPHQSQINSLTFFGVGNVCVCDSMCLFPSIRNDPPKRINKSCHPPYLGTVPRISFCVCVCVFCFPLTSLGARVPVLPMQVPACPLKCRFCPLNGQACGATATSFQKFTSEFSASAPIASKILLPWVRADFWEGDEDSSFSVFKVRRFSEWPEPLH